MNQARPQKIMFVCLGNICRSPLAQAVFDHQARALGREYASESSGTGAWHVGDKPDVRMRRVAGRHGVRIHHGARQFRPADLAEYDLILAMDRDNLRQILGQARSEAERQKVRLFRDFDPEGFSGAEVPDPYYGGEDGFEEVFHMAERTCRSLLERLGETAAGPPA
jgi:protein-tyrosine phosphatase